MTHGNYDSSMTHVSNIGKICFVSFEVDQLMEFLLERVDFSHHHS